ncbi:hypothetical protein [Sterolibacterium denitrificans]|nr:hypothetical protein [Sterolibacterium denitrificans]
MRKFLAFFVFAGLALVSLTGCEKYQLDAEARRLCAIDGGIKVYETVELPPEKFNEWGQPNFYRPDQGENALGVDYVFKKKVIYYRQGNPEMWKTHIQVIRRIDEKTLGVSTSYSRRGGDLPGPAHDSSFGCPEDRGDVPLLMRIFQQTSDRK